MPPRSWSPPSNLDDATSDPPQPQPLSDANRTTYASAAPGCCVRRRRRVLCAAAIMSQGGSSAAAAASAAAATSSTGDGSDNGSHLPSSRPPPPDSLPSASGSSGPMLFHCVQDTLDSGEDISSVATPVEQRTFLQEAEAWEASEDGGQRQRRHHHHHHRKKKKRKKEEGDESPAPAAPAASTPEPPLPPQQTQVTNVVVVQASQPHQPPPVPPRKPAQTTSTTTGRAGSKRPLIHKMSLPTVVVHAASPAPSPQQATEKEHRKTPRKKKGHRHHRSSKESEEEEEKEDALLLLERRRSVRSHSLTNIPPQERPLVPRAPTMTGGPKTAPPAAAPSTVMTVPQILHQPPTPTTPTDPQLPLLASNQKPAAAKNSRGQQQQQHGSMPGRTVTVPLLNLPQQDSDEDEEDNQQQERNNNNNQGEDENLPTAPCQITIECEVDPAAEEEEEERGKKKKHDRGRKRRRSLVNLLFPGKGNDESGGGDGGGGGGGDVSNEPTTPTLEAPQGQRLHFRRVSEIISRMGGGGGGGGVGLGSSGGTAGSRTMSTDDLSSAGSASPPAGDCGGGSGGGGGLSIRNLFPYRRRRSSVTHLDNTDQFKENREEVLQSQRRRMSSFPPMDGDEAAIMLEKANVVRLEAAHQEALALQNEGPVAAAFRRLRRGSRSPSPGMSSLLPGLSKAKKNKWKSSTDIHSDQQQQQPSPLVQHQQPSALPSHLLGNGNSKTGKKAKSKKGGPPPLLTSLSVTNACLGSGNSNVPMPSFPNVDCQVPPPSPSVEGAGAPFGPSSLPSDCGAAPPRGAPLPSAPARHAPLTSSVSCAPAAPETPRVGGRPLFVFPKRKVEDVPGIFIPKNKGGGSSGGGGGSSRAAEDGDTQIFSSAAANLLAVMRERPRRHSMGAVDPSGVAALQSFAQSVQQQQEHPRPPTLLPRSPYSTDCAAASSRYPS